MTGSIPQALAKARFTDETVAVNTLLDSLQLSKTDRTGITKNAVYTVDSLRKKQSLSLLEQFLAEYGLSTDEGVALMCLAEAYLRTPDALSLDALIRDKIGSGNWEQHLGTAQSLLINASSWGLMLTGKLLGSEQSHQDKIHTRISTLINRLSEPVIRKAVEQVMKILGRQFVMGTTIKAAIKYAAEAENKGYRHSYDMLGEAAITSHDAQAYFLAYSKAISTIADDAVNKSAIDNPGISVKLSALHPRYEFVQYKRVLFELVPRLSSLALLAKSANIGLTIDAEESERLELSLEVIHEVLKNPLLDNWDGFGIVIQAYLKQAPWVIDWVNKQAKMFNRKVSVRLVKGAYWDYEIKHAQVQGLQNYPVFTRKQSTDLSYLVCAEKLFTLSEHIYPQFATHNAHTAQSIIHMTSKKQPFEFQRLHGMGESLHELLHQQTGHASRIYAPVGVHKDLLAYLVRRLLENGANSSFIHKLHDKSMSADFIAADPISSLQEYAAIANPAIALPSRLFANKRKNSAGLSLNLKVSSQQLNKEMQVFLKHKWTAKPCIKFSTDDLLKQPVHSPVDGSCVGLVYQCKAHHVGEAINKSLIEFNTWHRTSVAHRAEILDRIACIFEENRPELISITTREAGKTRLDGILEIREAVDFCRYYAREAKEKLSDNFNARGPFACISPWNFPLAIFTGQVVAALVCGNTVLAKPAEQTPLTAALAVDLMYQAGIPESALILLPGVGSIVGTALTADPRITGICFTGSSETATIIDRSLACNLDPQSPFIAETGGINAMIVDSTALPEQAVNDIINSAFQSAGQRCSALRLLLLQEETAPTILEMLKGATMELHIGDPWDASIDVGPIIDQQALQAIQNHCVKFEENGLLLFKTPLPDKLPKGHFLSPTAFQLTHFEQLDREIFGPVLHILTYKEHQLDEIVGNINKSGFGLTLGIQSRIDSRIERICQTAHIGNIYVNRNQIGAVVGVQPFGGEGKSGTGPKAGGPNYLYRFCNNIEQNTESASLNMETSAGNKNPIYKVLQAFIEQLPESLKKTANNCLMNHSGFSNQPVTLIGPTGEANTLTAHPRGNILCLGGGNCHKISLLRQLILALLCGNRVSVMKENLPIEIARAIKAAKDLQSQISIASDSLNNLLNMIDLHAVASDEVGDERRILRKILADRDGARIILLSSKAAIQRFATERVISIDTTAAGGNTSLLTA